jgi:type I restriction enzyme M protein
MLMAKGSPSEVHAYVHIIHELISKKGWDKKDIYTQQEALKIKGIGEPLGTAKPENIIKISEGYYYVIEAKNKREKLEQAVSEAVNDYAILINKFGKVHAFFITGIAGNDDEGYISKSKCLINKKWQTITENDIEVTGLLSKGQIDIIRKQNSANIKEIEISEQEFLSSAEEINGILHEGGINQDYRARVMSALLLAIAEGSELNLDESPTLLIKSINSRVELMLTKHNKPAFSRYIKIELPSSEDNHLKFKKAIVLTIQELLGLNIRSAMNSGKDILGKFYEVFLKYGNGAKEIGIVLTPRHITKFAAEVMDINVNDIVFDPTCGTGGFLVSAFDEVRKKASVSEFSHFKLHGLYGVEQQDQVVALALVNMIFRGDGKNNIIEGDCFFKWLSATSIDGKLVAEYHYDDFKGRIPPVTKVLMNPPFPKKKTDYKEYRFIDQALKQMQDGGLLFSVLPYSVMVKPGKYKAWRQSMLKSNTLLAVITFPIDLFYPVGVTTIGVFIQKGYPHKKKQNVLWLRTVQDGLLKSKGKRLPNVKADNDLETVKNILKEFLANPSIKVSNIDQLQKASPIDFKDTMLELVPEAYLDQKPITDEEIKYEMDTLLRESVAFLITSRQEDSI